MLLANNPDDARSRFWERLLETRARHRCRRGRRLRHRPAGHAGPRRSGLARHNGCMSDYGQELQFGTFLTPDAARADRVVELALLTEAAGLDLATIQDHPYQGRFLDAWALIATILARSSTLRVTTNVSNLPLRPPYVLAKTVASLDVLSRGRVELGIGAGGFWDAIVSAGGPRRTPGEALAALADGIDVIREVWDRVGPAPLHDVEIWIGAIGPKMLELTGRVGDGWLPSQSYVPPDTLAERNARIDAAAVAAGRDPVAGPAALQREPVRRPGLGRVAGRADPDPRHQHLHRRRRRPRHHPAVRHRGRAGRPRAGGGRAGRCSATPACAGVGRGARWRRRRTADGRRRRTTQRPGAVGRVDAADVRLAPRAAGLDGTGAGRRPAPRRRPRPPAQRSSRSSST